MYLAYNFQLKNLGFTHIDALDPAEKMLEVSRRRNIYQRLICAFMNKNRNDDIDTGENQIHIFCDIITTTIEHIYESLLLNKKHQALMDLFIHCPNP